MFEQFFGFTKTPFGRDLEAKDLFAAAGHQELIGRLRYVAEGRKFGLFTGEVGSGKSTAARVLASQLNPAKYQALYISDSKLTPRNFYWRFCISSDRCPSFTVATPSGSSTALSRISMKTKEGRRW